MIRTSFFELFKIGPGPSSSHTVGPMLATLDFRKKCLDLLSAQQMSTQELKIRIQLYGSLAATGKGHGTDRAVVAGLYGQLPDAVDVDWLSRIWSSESEIYKIPFGQQIVPFRHADIFFDYQTFLPRHANALSCHLLIDHKSVLEHTYYSIGGGFIEVEGEAQQPDSHNGDPKYPYENMQELLAICKETDARIDEVLIANEMAIKGLSEQEILDKLDRIIEVMANSVEQGLQKEGVLPGGLGTNRRAKAMYQKASQMLQQGRHNDAFLVRLNAYALACSEENAAGRMVVTAPTNGAAGIIPAAIEYLRRDTNVAYEQIKRGLIVAALIGFVIKQNASISGAELGCMAEVGAASAMAAALFAYCFDAKLTQIIGAAEIAIEHHLGMTCDPIMGLVQVPCIERNAKGVVKAYNSFLLATTRESEGLISFDQVVEVMRQTGTDLSEKYKETAKGGLATSFGWGNMPGS